MGYIVLSDAKEYYKTGIYIPVVSDWLVTDSENWMDLEEYEFLVDLIWGNHMKGYMDIDTFITNEFKKPFCLFFTTNFKEEINNCINAGASVVGACCGSNPYYINALRGLIDLHTKQ